MIDFQIRNTLVMKKRIRMRTRSMMNVAWAQLLPGEPHSSHSEFIEDSREEE